MKSKLFKKIAIIAIIGSFIVLVPIIAINIYVISKTENNIITSEEAAKKDSCLVVLGAGVRNGKPARMLKDRLDKAIEIYNLSNKNRKIVMTGGDGEGSNRPDEIKAMTEYAIENGIEESDIIKDGKGYSTYESMENMVNEFGFSEFIVITQKYHLSRSMFSAQKMGADVYGVPAENIHYYGQIIREIREVLARVKDFGLSITK